MSEPARPRLDDALIVACGLAWGAGLIHVVAAFDHVDEYVPFAVFFALLAPLQFAWGVAVYRRPDRRLLIAGAVGSLAIVALWILSRTTGVPIGPQAWQPERVGVLDAICSADEAVLAALVFVPRSLRRPALGFGTMLILTSSLVLVGGGGHVH